MIYDNGSRYDGYWKNDQINGSGGSIHDDGEA